ncbi:dienelactone hydrolase family protein [Brevibacillus sp. SYSU BS000544]|uniref:dienelactone hydrolase family protein n=1 Tax=Brevibacillus sp. SYSU BS000544 TaxID=3416443 RepID=UPI003CE47646
MISINQNSTTAIIVVHEIYGLNQYMNDYCEKLARQGFDVYCPDLLQRASHYEYSEEPTAYVNFVEKIGFTHSNSMIRRLIGEIRNQYKYVFVIGFSVGATVAWVCSSDARVDGIVGYYGSRIRDFLEITPQCPVLLIYGQSEKSVDVDQLTGVLRLNKNITIQRFDGEHGFADWYSPKYNEGEGKRAWYGVLDFIQLIRRDHSMDQNIAIRQAVLDSATGLTELQFHQKPAEDDWSVKQVMEHLVLFDRILLERMKDALEQPDMQLDQKDLSPSADRSRRVKYPESMKPSDEDVPLEVLQAQLRESHQELVDFYHQLQNKNVLQRKGIPHERYGEMSVAQWIELAAVHDQRHLQQIQDIRSTIGI